MTQKSFTILTWKILALSIVLPFAAWGSSLAWRLDSLSPYQWFGLFGLLAWMIMWTHYISGTLRILTGCKKPSYYSRLTGWLVLSALLLHPGILAYVQFQNGAGLPPFSFVDYVGQNMLLAIMLGSIALTIFLSFEIFDRLKTKQVIKKNWWLISISQSLAMILIFVHGLQLGPRLQSGWFMWVWVTCGMLLLPCLYIIHKADFEQRILQKNQ